MKNIIFQIDGGLGKCIAATAVVEGLKKKYPNDKLIVISAYPNVFINNPNVSENFRVDQINGLYLSHIKDNNNLIFLADPYRHHSYFKQSKHVIKIWFEQFGLTYKGEIPKLYYSQSELDTYVPQYQTEKPIMVIQPNGGPPNLDFQYSWTRDIPVPTINQIIEEFKEDYTIVHIKRDDQLNYENTLAATAEFRSIGALIQLSSKRLFIDSFAQHMAKAVNKQSTVCWVSTKPTVFGYSSHSNIEANEFTKKPYLEQSVFEPFSLSEDITRIPYEDLNEVFNVDKIIKSVRTQK